MNCSGCVALKKQLELIKKVATRNIEVQEAYLKNCPKDPKIERARAQGAIEAFKVVLE